MKSNLRTFLATRWLLLTALALTGCAGTVTPDVPTPPAPSPGANGEHSGVYAYATDANGSILGQLWYENDRDAYNALIVKYGTDKQFITPLTKDYHLSLDIPDYSWYLSSALPKQVLVLHPYGFWFADQIAVTDYIKLLKDNRP